MHNTSVFALKLTSLVRKVGLFLALALGLGALSACSSDEKRPLESEVKMYERAKNAMKIGDFRLAVKRLEDLGANYPFGDYATQGELDLIYAYYKTDQPDEAISAAQQFQRYHPTNPNLDYTYYMQGVAEQTRFDGILSKWIKRKPYKFDQESMTRPLQYFSVLATRFPNSKYTPDARQRMIYLRNELAKSCMLKVKFYETQKAYLSALNRARTCIQEYDGAPAAEQALEHVTKNYEKLGLNAIKQP